MSIKKTHKVYIAVGVTGLGLLGAASLWARPPFTEQQLADQQQELLAVVNHGRDHPQGGNQLDVNSADMVALEAYAVYLYRGQKLQPGYTLPTPPDPVKSGVGYPAKPSGIGVDK